MSSIELASKRAGKKSRRGEVRGPQSLLILHLDADKLRADGPHLGDLAAYSAMLSAAAPGSRVGGRFIMSVIAHGIDLRRHGRALASVAFLAASFVACSSSNGAPSSPSVTSSATGMKLLDSGEDDASMCSIDVTRYDRSCELDSDCVNFVVAGDSGGSIPVQSGNYCAANCFCGWDAINRNAADDYARDVVRTPLFTGAVDGSSGCFCIDTGSPCCQAGTCMVGCFGAIRDAATTD
jgi:hypothetical protein